METQDSTDILIKRLSWVYFWLLIIEGALRKWFLPSLSTPLLIVRDPVLILIYLAALNGKKFPRTSFIAWIFVIAFLEMLVSFTGSGNIKTSLYGLRTNFLHLPLIFLMGDVLTPSDVKKIGKWVMIISVPMALLAFEQFRSPVSARINVGVGGEVGGQLIAASGKIRPSGTFSFVNGMVSYLSLTGVFVLYGFLHKKQYPWVIVVASLISLGLSLGISGSRSAVLTVSMVIGAALLACMIKGRLFSAVLQPLFAIYAVFLGLSLLPVFKEGMAIQQERFESSGGLHEGILIRLFEDFTAGFSAVGVAPMFGCGLGMGTNAGSGIMTGERTFLLAEGEWARVVMESGPILGFAFIGLRIAILIFIIRKVLGALDRENLLPALLLGAVWLELMEGQFSQPTAMGFIIFICGLCLAASRPDPDAPDVARAPATPQFAGRSRYAESLHGTR